MAAGGILEEILAWLYGIFVRWFSTIVPTISLPPLSPWRQGIIDALNAAGMWVPLWALAYAIALWLTYLTLWASLIVWRWVRTLGNP